MMKYNGVALLLATTAFSCVPSQNESSIGQLPNIVLLMGDDHGWNETGYNGHPFVKTPVLDEMAANGLRFDHFYAAHPNCSPTRGSILTGRHPNRYGTFAPNWSIRPEEFTIAHLLKNAGYRSAHFGKWHVGPVKKDSPTSPGAMGFDEWLSHDNFFEMDPVLSRNGEPPLMVEGEGSDVIVDAAIEFIERTHKLNRPFMTVVWFGSPHEPYSGVPEDLALYASLPDSLGDKKVALTSNETGDRVVRSLKDVLQERYAEITAMDRAIGKLRSYLRENRLDENTLVIYFGDNGTCATAARTASTLREEKGSLYDGGIRVPGVMEWPAVIKEPASTNAVAVSTDIMPTLAEITQQKLPDRPIDGISLIPVIFLQEKERRHPLFFWKFESGNVFRDGGVPYIETGLQEGTTPLNKMIDGKFTRNFRNYIYPKISEQDFSGEWAVFSNNYKLIVEGQSPNPMGYELYDIYTDPSERINLASDYPEKVAEMTMALRNWQESVVRSLTGADY